VLLGGGRNRSLGGARLKGPWNPHHGRGSIQILLLSMQVFVTYESQQRGSRIYRRVMQIKQTAGKYKSRRQTASHQKDSTHAARTVKCDQSRASRPRRQPQRRRRRLAPAARRRPLCALARPAGGAAHQPLQLPP
jgi:hypothetical protein